MEFEEACCEVDFILEHLDPIDKKKIPEKVIEFFKNNKDLFYKVNLSVDKPLAEQELKDETKAFLQILNYRYFANEAQKDEFNKIINEEEVEIFEEDINKNEFVNKQESNEKSVNTEMVVYKENKIKSFFKKILSFFRSK